MFPTTEMARPKQDATDGGTRHLRVYGDLADMVGWIVRIEKTSSAKLVDPLIRPQITARYKQIEKLVEQIKKAEDAARERSGG